MSRRCSALWTCRCSTPTTRCTACSGRAVRPCRGWRGLSRACRRRTAASTAACWAGRFRRSGGASAARGDRPSAGAPGGAGFPGGGGRRGTPVVVLDIPLLYETGGERRVDRVVAVGCSDRPAGQRALRRPGMTRERLEQIRAAAGADAQRSGGLAISSSLRAMIVARCSAAWSHFWTSGRHRADGLAAPLCAGGQGERKDPSCVRSCSIPRPPA